jgi:hypothetical protein
MGLHGTAPSPPRFCYQPHFDRSDQGLPNPKYLPHIHAPSTDRGLHVAIIWEPPDRSASLRPPR